MCVSSELKCAGNLGISGFHFSVVVVEVGERRILFWICFAVKP